MPLATALADSDAAGPTDLDASDKFCVLPVPATICVKNGRVLAQIKKQTPANEMAKAGKAARWGESGNGQTAWPRKFSCESAYFSCCSDYSPLCRKESALKIRLLVVK